MLTTPKIAAWTIMILARRRAIGVAHISFTQGAVRFRMGRPTLLAAIGKPHGARIYNTNSSTASQSMFWAITEKQAQVTTKEILDEMKQGQMA